MFAEHRYNCSPEYSLVISARKCWETWKVAVTQLLSGLSQKQSDFGIYELLASRFVCGRDSQG